MAPRKKSLIDKIINEYRYRTKQVKEATSFLDPVVDAIEYVDSNLPSGLFDEGVGRVVSTVGGKLNLDPTALMLLGSLSTGGKKGFSHPKRLSSGDPISVPRTANTPKTTPQPNPKGLKADTNRQPDVDLRGRAKGDLEDIARRTEAKLNSKGGSVSLDFLGDVADEARGPVLKQFGAYPKDIADQRAFVDADGPIPGSGGTKGRPSASASSKYLRELREGKRKASGLQAIKDRLNQGRQPSAPKQSTAPLPISPERSAKASKSLEDQIARKAIEERLRNPAQQRGQSVPETDFNPDRRRSGLPSEVDKPYVRRDKRGRVIRESKPESTGPVRGRSVGKKSDTGVSIEERRSGAKPYKGVKSLKRSADSGRTTVKGPDNVSVGRTFDKEGDLRGLKKRRGEPPKRSNKAQQQARSTLKSQIERLRGLPWSAQRSRKIQRLQALLKKMK